MLVLTRYHLRYRNTLVVETYGAKLYQMVLWLIASTSVSLCELVILVYLMIYSLAVIHVMPSILTLTPSKMHKCCVLNSAAHYGCNACTYPSCLLHCTITCKHLLLKMCTLNFLNSFILSKKIS